MILFLTTRMQNKKWKIVTLLEGGGFRVRMHDFVGPNGFHFPARSWGMQVCNWNFNTPRYKTSSEEDISTMQKPTISTKTGKKEKVSLLQYSGLLAYDIYVSFDLYTVLWVQLTELCSREIFARQALGIM